MDNRKIYHKGKRINFDSLPIFLQEKLLTLLKPKTKENGTEEETQPTKRKPTRKRS